MKYISIGIFLMLSAFCNVSYGACNDSTLQILPVDPHSKENIKLLIYLENVSDDIIDINGTMIPQDYWINLSLLKNGKIVKYKAPEYKLKNHDLKFRLRPKHVFGRVIDLGEMFGISSNGKFKLTVKYGIGPDLETSNIGVCSKQYDFKL
tara:strand:- start:1970 stop:2419 length:450 start_codon:yes stop_codon:yes gene_type:complete